LSFNFIKTYYKKKLNGVIYFFIYFEKKR
jgi:hypothetical protein